MNSSPSKKLLTICTASFLLTLLIGFVAFSQIVNFVVRDQTALKRRNLVRKYYMKLPIPLTFRVYFFNVTNPNDVMRGKKPILNEIGPYSYDTYKEKIDISDNDADDTLAYTPYETYTFNNELSGTLRPTDVVTIVNPLLIGVVNYILKFFPQLTPIANRSMPLIFDNTPNVFINVQVRDILFDGIVLNCTGKDYSVKAICNQLKLVVSKLIWPDPNVKDLFKFAFLNFRNGTLPTRLKVLRGIKKSRDLGRVVEFNEEKRQQIWQSKRCNRFKGTDSWIFPPLIGGARAHDGIPIFAYDICRNIHARYVTDVSMHGIRTVAKFYANLGDMNRVNSDDRCYCETPKTCLPKGVLDISKCLAPIFVTLPHFADADPALLDQVEGLQPDIDRHSIRILLDTFTGTPLEAQKRLQFNMPIKQTNGIDLVRNIKNVLHPVFWVEEEIILKGTVLNQIKAIFYLLDVLNVLKIAGLAISGAGTVYTAFKYYQECKQTKKVDVHDGNVTHEHVSDLTHDGGGNNNQSVGIKETNDIDSFDKY